MNSEIHFFDVKDRLEEARAAAARERLALAFRPRREPLRVILGLALIRLGRWLATAPRRRVEPRRAAA